MAANLDAYPGGLWALLRARAARLEGFSTQEIVDETRFPLARVGVACTAMRKKEMLVSLRLSHKRVRYFATQAAADAYLQRQSPSIKPLKDDKAARWANEEATIPEGLVVQVGPSHPPRNEMFEFPFLHTRKGL